MSNRIPFISAKRQPDEQGDVNDMKYNYQTLGEQLDEADNSSATPAVNPTSTADNNNCVTVETDLTCAPEDGNDRMLLIEDSVLTSRTVMASAGPPPPPPPPSSFGSMRPQAPSTPSPSRTPPPVPATPPPQLETADKAVQSPPLNTSLPVRRTEFARTIHTFFNEPHSSRSNVEENTADGAVQTAALVHAENPEVTVRSLVVPLALAAPCRSKPPRCPPSSSYERRGNSRSNGQISRDANNCAAGGDAASVAISSAGSSSPRYGFEDYHERARRRNSHGDDRSHKESCMESCIYYSVKCCECIVL